MNSYSLWPGRDQSRHINLLGVPPPSLHYSFEDMWREGEGGSRVSREVGEREGQGGEMPLFFSPLFKCSSPPSWHRGCSLSLALSHSLFLSFSQPSMCPILKPLVNRPDEQICCPEKSQLTCSS